MRNRALLAILLFLSALCGNAQIDADGVMRIGRTALYYEDYALSIQYFNQAIAAKPYLYSPYYYRAIAKYYLGDYNGAVADCSMSIERDPYIPEVYRLRAINYIRTDNFAAAAADYYTLIRERGVKDRDVWYNLVLSELELKNTGEADTLLDSMIIRWPDYARSYMLKAQIALIDGDTLRAGSLMDKTIELDPNDVDALSAKALLLLQMGDYSKGEQVYDRLVSLSPRQSGYYINRALARYQLNNLRGAMDDYNVALQLSPESYLAHYNRALLSMRVGENNQAISDFDFVLKKHPSDRLALYNRAILSQQTGDYRGAIRDYTTIINEFPNYAGAYVNRSYCYKRIGDVRRSEADDRRVIEIRLNEVYNRKTSSPLDMVTRSESNDDIENYDKLVTDSVENIVPFYASEYRGRVQNREYAIQMQPLYVLTFSKADNGLYHSAALSEARFVDELNRGGLLFDKISLSSKEAAMTPAEYEKLHRERNLISEKLQASPSDTTLLLIHAIYLSQGRDYESALQDLNQYIHRNPTSVAALFLRAVVKYKLQEIQTPKTEAKKGLSSEPPSLIKDPDRQTALASAISDLSVAIAHEPQCAYLYYNRGCLYSAQADYSKAEADFTDAIRLNPSLAEAYYNRGLCYSNQGDRAKAVSDLGKAGELGLYTAYSLIKRLSGEKK